MWHRTYCHTCCPLAFPQCFTKFPIKAEHFIVQLYSSLDTLIVATLLFPTKNHYNWIGQILDLVQVLVSCIYFPFTY